MKSSPAANTKTKRKLAGIAQLGGTFTPLQAGKPQATSLVLKTKADTRKQHAAIAKLVAMCKASPVVKNASRGITAEVRRDRNHGHE